MTFTTANNAARGATLLLASCLIAKAAGAAAPVTDEAIAPRR
jgi:hypothetical protein